MEARVLETPYYQRLRWVRQLGFSFYIFPGATHTRHAHALGVLHIMDKVLKSLGLAVSDDKLFNANIRDDKTIFHRTMRLAGMLHDVGTMPFSHTIEMAYMSHWRQQQNHSKTKYVASHENLGTHIIKNTSFKGGITKILLDEGIDPILLSEIIEGKSPITLANQLMHSDVDADRMDYLLRDAYHTGVQLGVYDHNLLIRNLTTHNYKGEDILCVKEDAISVVESFLTSRYFWYSQIINDGTGYKFDLIAAKIYEYFLENGMAYSFDHLMDNVSQNPNEYFTFNDSYFMAKVHEYLAGRITHPLIRELSEMLAQRIPPAQIKISPIQPTLVESEEHRNELVDRVNTAVLWLKSELHEVLPDAWMVHDIPTKDVIFTKSKERLKTSKTKDLILHRETLKVLSRDGSLNLLIDSSNSLLKILSNYRNFIPRVYVSPKTYEVLKKKGILDALKLQNF